MTTATSQSFSDTSAVVQKRQDSATRSSPQRRKNQPLNDHAKTTRDRYHETASQYRSENSTVQRSGPRKRRPSAVARLPRTYTCRKARL